MIAMLSAFTLSPSAWPMTILKATAVVAAAGVGVLVCWRASAAVRHLVWLLALASCVALALATPLAPRIALPLRALSHARGEAATIATVYENRAPRRRPIVVVEPQAITVGASRMKIVVPAVASERETPLTVGRALTIVTIGIWVVGCIVVLTRAKLGHSRVASIVDDGHRLISAEWRSAVVDASFDVGLRREVEVFESDEITSPMTSGFLNPVVVVPMEARHWDVERRRIVLVHELAHVARFDYLAQLIATLACAIFWFHPLVWLAATRLRTEAEHAADDLVLKAGTGGVTYASHLLDIARQQSGDLPPAIAVGMVKASRLEGRFRAMLDATRSRAAVSSRFQAVAASLTMAAMIPLAGVRPIAAGRELMPAGRVAPKFQDFPVVDLTAPRTAAIVAARAARAAAILVSVVDSVFEKTVDASAGDRLTLDLRSGGAIIIHGWDEPRVRVIGRLRGRDWRDTHVSLERVDGGLRLQSLMEPKEQEWSTAHEFELWVPRHTNIQLSSAGGSLAINDLSGDFYGHTGGGTISIQNATGSATLSTGGGGISIANSQLSGVVTTGGGGLSVANVTGGLRGSSGSGGTIITNAEGFSTVRGGVGYGVSTAVGGGMTSTVTSDGVTSSIRTGLGTNGVPRTTIESSAGVGGGISRGLALGGSGGQLTISKDGGEIVIDRAPDGAILHTGGGRIVVGSSGRGISASTGGGDIELNDVEGDATASTGSGDVHISVLGSSRASHSIAVQSGRGRVVIEVPADLDARIELETAYTNNFNRRTNITSDFALENSETDQWDSSSGTPRKYVRATGVVGNGRGLIRVRTVNGDVVLKRVNR